VAVDRGDAGSSASPAIPTIQRSSLQEQVRDAVEEMIVFGVLAPGERLAEGALAARLGVSRQPVREALRALASDGFVDLSPGRSATVHAPTMREIREVFHVRAILEADSCALAARTIDEAGVERLDAICADGEAALADRDTRRLIDLNGTFHGAITRIGGNNAAFELLERLQRRIAWHLTQIVVDRAPDSWVEHRAILHALADSDADLAYRRMLEHVHHSVEAIKLHQS
jgi:DNA-binding GntR family transcriptional regulator